MASTAARAFDAGIDVIAPPVDGGVIVSDACNTPGLCRGGNDQETGSSWVVCASDCTSAWVSANSSGSYHAQQICKELGYAKVGKIGGTCGNVCGFCDDGRTSCGSPGRKTFDGSGAIGSDGFGPILGSTVQWECLR